MYTKIPTYFRDTDIFSCACNAAEYVSCKDLEFGGISINWESWWIGFFKLEIVKETKVNTGNPLNTVQWLDQRWRYQLVFRWDCCSWRSHNMCCTQHTAYVPLEPELRNFVKKILFDFFILIKWDMTQYDSKYQSKYFFFVKNSLNEEGF